MDYYTRDANGFHAFCGFAIRGPSAISAEGRSSCVSGCYDKLGSGGASHADPEMRKVREFSAGLGQNLTSTEI